MRVGKKRVIAQADDIDRYLSRDEVFSIIGALERSDLRKVLASRTLPFGDRQIAKCPTSRTYAASQAQFLEEDFHAALTSLRYDDLLDFATNSLRKLHPESSAAVTVTSRQVIVMGSLAILFAAIFATLPLDWSLELIGLLLSLFFFSLVLVRTFCVIKWRKAITRHE